MWTSKKGGRENLDGQYGRPVRQSPCCLRVGANAGIEGISRTKEKPDVGRVCALSGEIW